MQETVLRERPPDAAARFTLVELLAFAGRFIEAHSHFCLMEVDDPAWPESMKALRRLFRGAAALAPHPEADLSRRTDPAARQGPLVSRESPGEGRIADAVRWVDVADALSPSLLGFIDGQEAELIRDADDRFGSVLEAFVNGVYTWLPWEAMRRIRLDPPKYLLDRLFRPAEILMRDGQVFGVHLPLVYPGSHTADGAFAVGLDTDCVCPDEGPIRCIGGKLLEAANGEVPLSECRMIEIRGTYL